MPRVVTKATTADASRLMLEGAITLAAMEHVGICVDVPYLKSQIAILGKESAEFEIELRNDEVYRNWRRAFGVEANLDSRSQLGHVLFNVMGLPCTVYTKSSYDAKGKLLADESKRRPSTDDAVLKGLQLPFIDKYLRLAHIKKAKSTYLDGLLREVVDGRVHADFKLHTVETYRSCMAKGTLVNVLRDGLRAQVPIEEVNEGDMVETSTAPVCRDFKPVVWVGQTGIRQVITLTAHRLNFIQRVRLTPEHRVMLSDGHSYKEAADLVVGDRLRSDLEVVSVSDLSSEQVAVYDLEVEDTHNFFANDICVHNSCSSPNIQNQINRDPEMAKIIRRCYIPSPGHVLMEVDEGQLEFRIAASHWEDAAMIDYCEDENSDVHKDYACRIFCLEPDQVDKKTTRDYSKNRFIFPTLYGSYWKNTSVNLWEGVPAGKLKDGSSLKKHLKSKGLSTYEDFAEHVRSVEGEFYRQFSGFSASKDRWEGDYRRRGWFDMRTGFRVHGIFSRNFLMNSPIQGPAFHLVLWSANKIHRWLIKHNMRTKLVAEIHDCLIFDAHPDEVQDVLTYTVQVMTQDVRKHWPWVLAPLTAEADVTPVDGSWADKEPWVCASGLWQPKRKAA